MSSDVKHVSTEKAPTPAGHYAQATIGSGHVYIAGQLPITADRRVLADATFEIQARQALGNMLAILDAAGGRPEHLLKVTAYIVDVAHWPAFNAVFAELLGEARPARTVVPVPHLHHGVLVEVDAIAVAAG